MRKCYLGFIREDIAIYDIFLYDLKHINSESHQEYTGVRNERILQNLKLLSERGRDIEIRIPIIPGVNDSSEIILQTVQFHAGLANSHRIRLLSYHSLAGSKYNSIGKENTMLPVDPPTMETIDCIVRMFKRCGIKNILTN